MKQARDNKGRFVKRTPNQGLAAKATLAQQFQEARLIERTLTDGLIDWLDSNGQAFFAVSLVAGLYACAYIAVNNLW